MLPGGLIASHFIIMYLNKFAANLQLTFYPFMNHDLQYPIVLTGPLNNWQPAQPFGSDTSLIKRQLPQFLSGSIETGIYASANRGARSVLLKPLISLQLDGVPELLDEGSIASEEEVSSDVVPIGDFDVLSPQALNKITGDVIPKVITFKKISLFMIL